MKGLLADEGPITTRECNFFFDVSAYWILQLHLQPENEMDYDHNNNVHAVYNVTVVTA